MFQLLRFMLGGPEPDAPPPPPTNDDGSPPHAPASPPTPLSRAAAAALPSFVACATEYDLVEAVKRVFANVEGGAQLLEEQWSVMQARPTRSLGVGDLVFLCGGCHYVVEVQFLPPEALQDEKMRLARKDVMNRIMKYTRVWQSAHPELVTLPFICTNQHGLMDVRDVREAT